MNAKWILTVLLTSIVFSCYSNIRLPRILGSDMVLQQQSKVRLWGWGEPNEKLVVTTSWDKKTYPAVTVTGNADWALSIQTPAAGGPYTITLKGYNSIVLSNIMIGEVWVCSGQSNMEMCGNWGLQDVRAEYAKAHLHRIRFFHVPKRSAGYPQQDCGGTWEACDSNSLPSFSAAAYFFGKALQARLGVPVGLIESCWSGASAEVWTPDSVVGRDAVLKAAAKKIAPNGQVPNLPGYAYNAMIAPITRYAVAGVIWYQGENNTGTAGTYPRLFTSMIDSWRQAWKEDLPFYFVQVAPFRYALQNVGALMREAQTECMGYPNTGMAVITDLVADTNNVHPSNKHEVGLRLANWALAETYHQPDIDYCSPLFDSLVIEGDRALVYFAHAGEGLVIRGKQAAELYIAGADRVFYPAGARMEKDRMIVRSKLVKKPVAVRYGFGNAAIGNIFGKDGLPLGPFRTDRWPVENEYGAGTAMKTMAAGGEAGASTIVNPVLNHDFPDPTVIYVNGKYYGYATNSVVHRKYMHIQLATSTDIAHWKDEGDALPAGAAWAKGDYWAPHVIYDKQAKKYVLYYSAQSREEGVGKCIGVAFSDEPGGPFTDTGVPLICGKAFENIDPCAIIDPKSGKRLLYWGSDSKPLHVQELSDDWRRFKEGSVARVVLYPEPGKNYERLIEGSWVDYYKGYYYLYYSGDNCCGASANYAVMVARSRDPMGPFQRLGEANGTGNSVILEKNKEWFAPGHNSIFRDGRGNIYIAYHAFATGVSVKPVGRVLLISPVVYRDGWPVVLYGD